MLVEMLTATLLFALFGLSAEKVNRRFFGRLNTFIDSARSLGDERRSLLAENRGLW
jgi:hypothetical protein